MTLAGDAADGFVAPNVTLLAQKFWGGWEASASLHDLSDTDYGDPAADIDSGPHGGRTFRVKLLYRF